MPLEHAIAIAALAFLSIGGVLLGGSVVRGRALCAELARRHPVEYEELGLPRPGFFHSARRSAYMRFIFQNEFERLPESRLVERFAGLRRSEVRHLVFLLVGFAVFGAAAVWIEFLSD